MQKARNESGEIQLNAGPESAFFYLSREGRAGLGAAGRRVAGSRYGIGMEERGDGPGHDGRTR